MPPASTARCSECQSVRPLTQDHWVLRTLRDPTGIAYREFTAARRRAKVSGPLSQAEYADLAALRAQREADHPDAPLWVQSRCRMCGRRRARRQRLVRGVIADLEQLGVVATLRNAETQIVTNQLPPGWLDEPVDSFPSRAEFLAANAIVTTRVGGEVHLPDDHTKALRAAYRLLIPVDPDTTKDGGSGRSGRLGAVDSDRRQMLEHVKRLAKEPGVPQKLVKQVEHVEKIAFLHAGGDDANAVAPALLEHLSRYHGKFAAAKYSAGLMTKEEAESRLNAGNLIGLLKWSPLHESGAAPGTVAGWWAARELQVRSRADRAIGVYEIEKGVWSSAATSLEGIASSGNDGGFVPNMRALNRDTVVGGGQRRNNATVDSGMPGADSTISIDMQTALSTLPTIDRHVLLAWADDGKLSHVSEALGITLGEAKRRLNNARLLMQERLAGY